MNKPVFHGVVFLLTSSSRMVHEICICHRFGSRKRDSRLHRAAIVLGVLDSLESWYFNSNSLSARLRGPAQREHGGAEVAAGEPHTAAHTCGSASRTARARRVLSGGALKGKLEDHASVGSL